MASGFVLFLLFIIATLQINIVRTKRAERELFRKKEDLVTANDELTVINEELVVALQEIKEQDEKIHNLIYKDVV